MTIQKVLEFDATEALEALRQVIDSPVLRNQIAYTDELKLKEAMDVLDKLVTELKSMDNNLKE